MPQVDPPAAVRRRWYGGTVVRIAIVIVIYIVIFKTVDVAGALSKLRAETAWAFIAGVVLMLGQMAVCTARWRLLVATPTRPGFASSYWTNFEGSFINQAVPSTLGGDAWRVIRWRAAGVSTRAAAASVILDRLSGAMGAAILAIFTSWLLWLYGVDARWTLSILSVGTLVVGGGAVFLFLARREGLHLLKRIPAIHLSIAKISGSLVSNRIYMVSLLYSMVAHLICGIVVYLAARSLTVDVSFALIVGVTACALLVTMISISLAGWGVREASFVTLLAPLGVNKEYALLIGVLFGLVCLVSALPGGLCLLVDRRNDRLRDHKLTF